MAKPSRCNAVLDTWCGHFDKQATPCGEFEDNPVPHNGVHRTFHFYACYDRSQAIDSCETGPGGIRGEIMCAQFEMEDNPRHVSCTCWARDTPTETNNNIDKLAYRRQVDTQRVFDSGDGNTVKLGSDGYYMTDSSVRVEYTAPRK